MFKHAGILVLEQRATLPNIAIRGKCNGRSQTKAIQLLSLSSVHSWLTEGAPGSAKAREPICEGKCHRPASLSAIAYTPTTACILVFTSLSLSLSFSTPFFPASAPSPLHSTRSQFTSLTSIPLFLCLRPSLSLQANVLCMTRRWLAN